MRLLLVLVLFAPAVLADVTATIRWTAPKTTQDGTPLTGRYALTEYQIFINGVATSVPASVTTFPVNVASGHSISVYIKACHASRCSGPSKTIKFDAPAAAASPPPSAPVAPLEVVVGADSAGGGDLLWSGTGEGSEPAGYGRPFGNSYRRAIVVSVEVTNATGGPLVSAYPFRLEVADGRIRAAWRDSKRPEGHLELTHPAEIDGKNSNTVVFTCDPAEDVWALEVDGAVAYFDQAPRCVGHTWGGLNVGGAGGKAKIEIRSL